MRDAVVLRRDAAERLLTWTARLRRGEFHPDAYSALVGVWIDGLGFADDSADTRRSSAEQQSATYADAARRTSAHAREGGAASVPAADARESGVRSGVRKQRGRGSLARRAEARRVAREQRDEPLSTASWADMQEAEEAARSRDDAAEVGGGACERDAPARERATEPARVSAAGPPTRESAAEPARVSAAEPASTSAAAPVPKREPEDNDIPCASQLKKCKYAAETESTDITLPPQKRDAAESGSREAAPSPAKRVRGGDNALDLTGIDEPDEFIRVDIEEETDDEDEDATGEDADETEDRDETDDAEMDGDDDDVLYQVYKDEVYFADHVVAAFIALRWGKFVCRAVERSEGRGMGRESLRGKGWGRCAAVLDAAVAGCAFATGREDLVRALIRAGPLV